MMSDEGFEKGLKLLLNNAYNKPAPSEEFRADLLKKLRAKQRTRRDVRRHRVIALYSSITAVAAVALFTFIPVLDPQIEQPASPSQPSMSSFAQLDAVDHLGSNFATPVSYPSSSASLYRPSISKRTTVTPISKKPLAALGQLADKSAHAINPIQYRTSKSDQWHNVAASSDFKLRSGMELRTPLGAVEPVSFAVSNGPMVMLDGSSSVEVADNGLRLVDGRAVVSMANTANSAKVSLQDHDLALQPGAMAFMRMDQSSDFADNGAPAPVVVLLKGEAATIDNFATRLASGRVYELYNTGTGKFPSREIGSYETERRFMPMINAIQAANIGY